jgi:hypothetical protein
MASSGLLRRVALIRTDVSEGFSASFVPPKRQFLKEPHGHIPEDAILHSHRSENTQSYIDFVYLLYFLVLRFIYISFTNILLGMSSLVATPPRQHPYASKSITVQV